MTTEKTCERGHGMIWMALVLPGFLGMITLTIIHGAKLLDPIRAVAVLWIPQPSPHWSNSAVIGLNDTDCQGNQNGVIFGGSADIHIHGGGIWANGCLRGDGNLFHVTVEGGSVRYVGELSGNMNFDPKPVQVPYPLEYRRVPPNCANPNAHHLANLVLHNGTLTFDPGLYCIDGDILIDGGDIIAEGVTFYLPAGDVTITGNAEVALSSPAPNPDPSPALRGMLFYVEAGDITIEGNSTSQYVGVVYARNGRITIEGVNGTAPTFDTQIIGYNVAIGGNADIDINYHRFR